MTNLPVTPRSYHRSASLGMLWTSLSVTIAKAGSFLAQLVLGWILSKGDFAIYALAISTAAMISVLRNGGIFKVLVQRGTQYEELAAGFFKIALAFNLLIAAFLFAISPLVAHIYKAPSLPHLIWVIALAAPITTPGLLFRAKLSIDLRFGSIARIDSISSLIRYGSMIGLALAGFGAMSFVLPLIIVALYEWIAFQRLVGRWPLQKVRLWLLFRNAFKDTRWVMLGSLVVASSLQSDYLIIGLFQSKPTLGVYFFAFQLTIAFSVLFTSGIDSVMLPSFAGLAQYPARQSDAFLKAMRVLSFVVTPLAVGAMLLVDPMIRVLWAGKWNPAIVVAQFMLATLVTRLPFSLALSLMESRGLWRARTLLQGLDSLCIIAAVTIGACIGGLLSITIWSCAYRLLGGLLFCASAARKSGIAVNKVAKSIAAVVFTAATAGILTYLCAVTLWPTRGPLVDGALRAFTFTLLFGTISFLLMRGRINETIALLRPRPSPNLS